MSGPLDPRLLLRGYAAGIFPMADSRDADDIFWVEPRTRAILPIDHFHCSRSLARRLRSDRFRVTRDQAFHQVVLACANRDETWINDPIERATLALHATGHAHSIECWDASGALVGGLYGVKLGRAFFGESMFSRATDASKVALAWLVARLRVGGFTLLDCQFMTDHLASLGATSVSRDRYARLLGSALGGGAGFEGGAAAAGESPSAGASSPAAGAADPRAAPDFFALDALLDELPPGDASAGIPGAGGKLIAQLLGHTS
ncbi:leucyl/phenylalanyl-tRNA--protein transferase [Sphingomonas sp. ASV193]|uniref:leucyl/phenylalanyl-tRNA--protein transferase n=1 Tax=Sphingomonas sp. ASV193 TaxID=3144405 RepID=UPI0032E9118C